MEKGDAVWPSNNNSEDLQINRTEPQSKDSFDDNGDHGYDDEEEDVQTITTVNIKYFKDFSHFPCLLHQKGLNSIEATQIKLQFEIGYSFDSPK